MDTGGVGYSLHAIFSTLQLAPQVTPQVAQQVTPQVEAILNAARLAASAEALQRAARLEDRVYFLKSYLRPLLERGWLERTIPDKPRSRMQRYRTTKSGLVTLRKVEREG